MTCKVCGNESKEGKDYCSIKCKNILSGKTLTKVCVNCGKTFYLSPSIQRQRPLEGCCSNKCNKEYYIKDRNPNWKGGSYTEKATKRNLILHERPEAVNKYLADHRLIASKHIGRYLKRQEPILHLNGNKKDKRPENLYICESNRELLDIVNGLLPRPDIGNLDTYKGE